MEAELQRLAALANGEAPGCDDDDDDDDDENDDFDDDHHQAGRQACMYVHWKGIWLASRNREDARTLLPLSDGKQGKATPNSIKLSTVKASTRKQRLAEMPFGEESRKWAQLSDFQACLGAFNV